MKILTAIALALPLAFTGCAGASLATSLSSQIQGTSSQFDDLITGIILTKAAYWHNLRVGLDQIDATQGMVLMVPMVGTSTPTMPVMMPTTPVPVMPTTPVMPVPTTPTGGIPTGPTNNG